MATPTTADLLAQWQGDVAANHAAATARRYLSAGRRFFAGMRIRSASRWSLIS